MNGFNFFKEESITISNMFPGLQPLVKDGKPIVAGTLEMIDQEGIWHTSYTIEIHPVKEYPNRFPFVFETGGRIPHNIDWHVFQDGHACLKSQPEEWLACKAGINLVGFIENEVTPYFFNQLHREKHGYFLQERSHGSLGQLEFFFDLLGTTDLLELYRFLQFVRNRKEPTRTENCFCGSGEKYRRCHREAYRQVAQFNDVELDCLIVHLVAELKSVLHP